MKRIYIAFFILCIILPAYSQSGMGLGVDKYLKTEKMAKTDKSGGTKNQKQRERQFGEGLSRTKGATNRFSRLETAERRVTKVITNDSAYYANVVKKNGWFVGIGKRLTSEEIGHMRCCYKLSHKNTAGNWTRMEAVNYRGEPTTRHSITTYLVNHGDDRDTLINREWKEKLASVCKWEFIGDATGKEVIQERALDADGAVVYVYSPVKVADREYVGTYMDSWGMPIFLRTDSAGTDIGSANFVHITRDNRGYEVLFSFTDRLGIPQKNKDGAYQTRKEYDDRGNQTLEASLNLIGERMIDDFGNCGWEAKFDNDNNQTEVRYYDAQWRPMRMPVTERGSSSDHVYGKRYEYDKWGRQTEETFIDVDGNPDVDDYGVHQIKGEFNEHGYFTSLCYYGIDGRLVARDSLGIAQVHRKYDDHDRLLVVEYKGKDGQYVNGPGNWCKEVDTYQSDRLMSEVDYVIDDNQNLVTSFEYHRDDSGNSTKKWHLKDKCRVDSVDAKGRKVMFGWYDLKGNPIENGGLHRYQCHYDDVNNMEVEEWLDAEFEAVDDDDRGYTKNVVIVDSVGHTKTRFQYLYGFLANSFVGVYSPDFSSVVQAYDITLKSATALIR